METRTVIMGGLIAGIIAIPVIALVAARRAEAGEGPSFSLENVSFGALAPSSYTYKRGPGAWIRLSDNAQGENSGAIRGDFLVRNLGNVGSVPDLYAGLSLLGPSPNPGVVSPNFYSTEYSQLPTPAVGAADAHALTIGVPNLPGFYSARLFLKHNALDPLGPYWANPVDAGENLIQVTPNEVFVLESPNFTVTVTARQPAERRR